MSFEKELPLWEPLIRLYEHRDGGASYHLKIDWDLGSGRTQEVLVALSETELTISCLLDSDKVSSAERVIDLEGAGFKILESKGAYRLTQSINHLDEDWDLFEDFDGQLRSLAAASIKINEFSVAEEPEYEWITRQEVEVMFNITLTDSQWRAVCAEMQEQPDEDNIDEFPTFQSVLEDVISHIDTYEQDWIVWDKALGQTSAQALEKYEPNSTKLKE